MIPDRTADPPRHRFRHWKRWLLASVVAIVVLLFLLSS